MKEHSEEGFLYKGKFVWLYHWMYSQWVVQNNETRKLLCSADIKWWLERTARSFKSNSVNEGEFSVFGTCSAFQMIYALLKIRLLLSNCTYNIEYTFPTTGHYCAKSKWLLTFLLVLMIYAKYKNTIANIFIIILPFSL